MRCIVVNLKVVGGDRTNLGESLGIAGRQFVESTAEIKQVSLRGHFTAHPRVMKSGSLLFSDLRLTFEDRDLVYAVEVIVLEDEAQPARFNRFVQKDWDDPVGVAPDFSFRHGFPSPFVLHLELKVLNGITGFALPSGRKVEAAESLFLPQVNLQ